MSALTARISDVDEARDIVGRHFYANRIDVLAPAASWRASFDVVPGMDGVTIGDMIFGVDVRIAFGELGAYHLDVPLSGRLAWRQGRHEPMLATPTAAAVFQPTGDATLERWGGDCRLLAVKIDPAVLERELSDLLDAPVKAPVRFSPVLDLRQPAGASWIRLLRVITADAVRPNGLAEFGAVRRRLREALITGLLHAAGHQYRDRLDNPHAMPTAPAAIRRVVEAIQSVPEHDFTLGELAALAGVGRRSLQQSFRRYVGSSPMAYLRQVRLERAHRDLRRADPVATTVAEVAHRYGFTHLSRFAADYRARYGVLPSHTLRV